MKNLERLSALELGRLVRTKEISPVEVIRYFAGRIEVRNPSINAFVYTKIDEALEEARALEKRILSGEDTGLFSGVPVALKDFLPSKKGWTNSHGGVKLLIKTDDADSEFYKAARSMGAVALGKTNAPAFAFRGTCDNRLYGPTSTPFNAEYNSGGSSGGSAAAVADGLVPLAEGSDGGGSIRIPSAWCGCFGFKPSVGLVPSVCRPDAWAATHPYCFDGAITRTVADSAAVYSRMAYRNVRDPLSLDSGSPDFTELMKKPVKGMRVGFTADFGVFEVDDEVKRIVQKAALKLTEAGMTVEPLDFSLKRSQNELAELWCRSISIDTSIELELMKRAGFDLVGDHRDELPEEFIFWNEAAAKSTVMDYYDFNVVRTELLDAFENAFEKFDIIVSPVTVCLPVKNAGDKNTKGPDYVNGKKCEPLIGFCETFFANFTGNPAASVPAGLSESGLPVGMQIIGRKFRDSDVFAVSRAFEQIKPWSYEIPWGRKI